MKYKWIILLLIGITTLVFLKFPHVVYEEYLKVFKKSGMITHRNQLGNLSGEVVIYKNGVIEEKANFVNGLKDGWTTDYYENGVSKKKMFFKNNYAEGIEYQYYENGKLNYRANLLHGKRYGSLYWYLENGQLDSYAAFNIEGESFCKVQYNNSGKFDNMQGFLVSPLIYSVNSTKDSTVILKPMMHYHDIKNLFFTIATPPKLHRNFIVEINDKSFNNLPIQNNTIKISNAFPLNGTYQILVKGHETDKSNKEINVIYLQNAIIKE